MKPDEAFLGQPIRSIQTMLRTCFSDQCSNITLIPDGIYGPQTMYAVSQFQEEAGLPVTGITNLETWNRIVQAYHPALVRTAPAEAIEIILNPGQIIQKGESHPYVYLAQGMLKTLSDLYGSITPPSFTGTIDLPTSESIESFQLLSRLEATGALDKNTWQALSLQYPLSINLYLAGKTTK